MVGICLVQFWVPVLAFVSLDGCLQEPSNVLSLETVKPPFGVSSPCMSLEGSTTPATESTSVLGRTRTPLEGVHLLRASSAWAALLAMVHAEGSLYTWKVLTCLDRFLTVLKGLCKGVLNCLSLLIIPVVARICLNALRRVWRIVACQCLQLAM